MQCINYLLIKAYIHVSINIIMGEKLYLQLKKKSEELAYFPLAQLL